MASTPYDDSFFAGQSEGSRQAASEFLPIVLSLVSPQSVLDVGCGVGAWLAVAADNGVADILGVDGPYVNPEMLQIPRERFRAQDLAAKFDLGRRFDLAITLEVAEHISPSAAGMFVDNLVRHAPVVMFSAAIPGQGGTFHVNEQWPDYWAERFDKRNYVHIDCLRDRVWGNSRIPVCYRQNAFLYVEREFLASHSCLLAESRRPQPMPVSVVHPELFTEVLSRPLTTRRIVKDMPSAFLLTLSTKLGKLVRR
jgi:SAM-dependent methyltransferase